MNNIKLTQAYMLCAMNKSGKMSNLSTDKLVCLIAASLIELQFSNCISIIGNNITIKNDLSSKEEHLRPLYSFISQNPSINIKKILNKYCCGITNKKINELKISIIKSLSDSGMVEESIDIGFFTKKTCYIPKIEFVEYLINLIRSELKKDTNFSEKSIALIILLEKGKCMKKYFTKEERKEMKPKIKDMQSSPSGKLVNEMINYIDSIMVAAIIASSSISSNI